MKMLASPRQLAGADPTDSGDDGKFDYGLETVFAVTTSLQIATLFFFVQIKFGTDYEITHLSTKPYLIAMALLVFMMVEIIIYLFCVQIVFVDDFTALKDSIILDDIGFQIVFCFVNGGKTTMVLLFFLERSFENTVLSEFIRFQHGLRLEQLEIAKDSYQRKEKDFFTWVKLNRAIFCISMLVYASHCVYLSHIAHGSSTLDLSVILLQLIPVLIIAFALTRYCSSTATLLFSMYRYHRFAFNSHIVRLGLTFVLQTLCLFACFEFQIFAYLNWLCQLSYESKSGDEFMYDENSEKPGICTHIIKAHQINLSGPNSFGTQVCLEDCILLLPIIFFFLLDRPHDCFKCVGKDPSRLYSTFQLTSEETAKHVAFARIGPTQRQAQKQFIDRVCKGGADSRVTLVTTCIDEKQLIPRPGEKQPMIDELVYRYGGSMGSDQDSDLHTVRDTEAIQNLDDSIYSHESFTLPRK